MADKRSAFKALADVNTATKLLLLVLIPLTGALLLAGAELMAQRATLADAVVMQKASQMADVSGLVHAIQKERGRTLLYLGDPNANARREMLAQRAATDDVHSQLRGLMQAEALEGEGRSLQDGTEQAVGQVDRLGALRTGIDAGSLDKTAALAAYNEVNHALIRVSALLGNYSPDVQMARRAFAEGDLLRAKEVMGQQRAVLSNALAAGALSDGVYEQALSLAASHDVAMARLAERLTDEEQAFLRQTLGADGEALRTQQTVLAGLRQGRVEVASDVWFQSATAYIDQLYLVEQYLARRMAEHQQALITDARRSFWETALEVAALLLLTLLGTWLVARSITRPLAQATAVARRIAEGDLTVEVPYDGRRDELGVLLGSMQEMVRRLRGLTQEVMEGINVLAASSTQISASVSQVTQSVTEMAASVTETTATSQEVRQTAEVSSEKAQAVATRANALREVSETGRAAIEETVEGMNQINHHMGHIAERIVYLSEQGKAIGDIITSVKDLAEQSNILAVNASIEAAKAGEQGKGFAVLAQEIRSLAEQSKEATLRVRGSLTEIQQATSEAVMATEQGGKAVSQGLERSHRVSATLQQLTDSIVSSTQAAMQIESSSHQQVIGMDQITQAMQQIRDGSEMNRVSMSQLETASRELQTIGSNLEHMAGQFKLA